MRLLILSEHVSADERPVIPDIQVNFHHDFHFEVLLVHVSAISPEMHAAAVSICKWQNCSFKA